MDRQAIFTGNNNASGPSGGSVPAWRPGIPSSMPAVGDLELRGAYSEVISIGLSIFSADSLDAVLAAMNKSVDVLAGRGQASLPHGAFTVSVVTATWIGIIVLSKELFIPGVILSQSWWGHNQTQHEDQQQGPQTHCHLFQQRFLPRTKSSNGGVMAPHSNLG